GFTLELIARGPELELRINGREAARTTDTSFDRGEIQLEVAGTDTVVRFRKIEIQELPAGRTDRAVAEPLGNLVAARERGLQTMKDRFFAGQVRPLAVVAAESELLEARIRLAESEGNPKAVVERLRELV